MGRKTNFLLATTSFIGGIATGLLLAPKKGSQNRAWVTDNATELANWVDTQSRFARIKSNRKLRKIRRNVQQGISQHIPNLFEATQNIDLSKNDIISE
jgi:gas vesicle protein